LRGPFDGVDFRNLGRDDQPGDLEQLVWRDVSVADDVIGVDGISQATVAIGRASGLLPEFIDKNVVFPGKDVVVEAGPDAPVIWKGCGLLTGPLRIDQVT
jgi:hypothetical protein